MEEPTHSFIPYNKAHIGGKELYYIAQAVDRGELKGDGPFTHLCNEWFKKNLGINQTLLTQSCTAALEMAAHLIDIKPGDEVILPSYTFTSTANAFVLRGAKPIFIDIRPDTLNMDESLLPKLITSRTKAICVMHYAGVSCEMDVIMDIAAAKNLHVIEDAAHAIMSTYNGKFLGTIGDIGTFSFHETKNFSSGEGGALLLNKTGFSEKAEIIAEKGTNRSKFFRGEVDKYTWVDIGSSYFPSEIIAAFLYGQLERADAIQARRMAIWQKYYDALKILEEKGEIRLPIIPSNCRHNAHLFYILFSDPKEQQSFISYLRGMNIGAVFHYYPLHLSPMGERFGYEEGDFPVTERAAANIVRLPLFFDLTTKDQDAIIKAVFSFFESRKIGSLR